MKNTQAFGEVYEGLYLLQPSNSKYLEDVVSFQNRSNFNSNPSSFSFYFPLVANVGPNDALWHVRLGHLPYSVMKKLSFIHFASKSSFVCDVCPKARQTRLPFPVNKIHSLRVFDLIHIDTWDPYKFSTYNGYRYFLTIVDDYSKATWTFLLSSKSNAFPTLKNFFAYD